MSRRLHACLACEPDADPGKFSLPRGFTRHADRICSRCRDRGVHVQAGQIIVPLSISIPSALLGGDAWHGTDCGCVRCAADRIPGRYA